MLKKFSDLNHHFTYRRCILKTTLEDPASDTSEAAETWKERANAEDVHYQPLDDGHINAIFNPDSLLARTRDPDHFWSPIIGLHLGLRLGEFVAAKVCEKQELGSTTADHRAADQAPFSALRGPRPQPRRRISFPTSRLDVPDRGSRSVEVPK